jgi:uncharacterized protein involved in outer membrane biogenesis
MAKRAQKTVYWLGGIILVFTLTALVISQFEFDLGFLRPRIVQAIEKQTGLKAELKGDIILRPSLWSTFKVAQVAFYTPHEANQLIFSLGELQAKISLLSIISGELRAKYVHVQEVYIQSEGWENLSQNDTEAATPQSGVIFPPALEMDDLKFERVSLVKGYGEQSETLFHLQKLQGSIKQQEPFKLQAAGRLFKKPFDLILNAEGLAKMNRKNRWLIKAGLLLEKEKIDLDLSFPTPMTTVELKPDFRLASSGLSKLGELLGIRLDLLGAVSLKGSLNAGSGSIELSNLDGRLAGGRISGKLWLSKKKTGFSLKSSLKLSGVAMQLPDLADKGDMPPRIELGRSEIELTSKGKDQIAFARALSGTLTIRNGGLTFGKIDNPRRWELNQASVELFGLKGSTARAKGRLLNKAFQMNVRAGGLYRLLADSEGPVEIEFTGAGASFNLAGELQPFAEKAGPHLKLFLNTADISTLGDWLGFEKRPHMPLKVKAEIQLTENETKVNGLTVKLGKTNLNGYIYHHSIVNRETWAFMLRSRLIVLQDLLSVLSGGAGAPSSEKASGMAFDMPLLPQKLKLPNMNLDLEVLRLLSGKREFSRAKMKGSLVDGKIKQVPLRLRQGDLDLNCILDADLNSAQPWVRLKAVANKVDIRELLLKNGVHASIPFFTDKMEVLLNLRGDTLHDLLNDSEAELRFGPGKIELLSPHSSGSLPLHFSDAKIKYQPNKIISLEAQTKLWLDDVKLNLDIGPLPKLVEIKGPIPVKAIIIGPHAELSLTGTLNLPIKEGGVQVALELNGKDLSKLTMPKGVNLPGWGPYKLSSRFDMGRNGYGFNNLNLKVGNSRLTGSGNLVMRAGRPKLDLKLVAESLQYDDFQHKKKSGSNSAQKSLNAKDTEARVGSSSDKSISKHTKTKQNSPKVKSGGFWVVLENAVTSLIESIDCTLHLEARSVASGKDFLGKGQLILKSSRKGVTIDPFKLELPGGEINLGLNLFPQSGGWEEKLWAKVRNFNYGVLARRWLKGSKAGGIVNLNLRLEGETPSLPKFLAHANGQFDFVLLPKNMTADFMELWVLNLINLLLPRLDPKYSPKLNCLVGLFDLKKGLMKDKIILMDTTGTMVKGRGEVDLKKETLHLQLKPQSKTARFFTFSPTVEAKGPFDDVKIGVPGEDLLGSIMNFFASPISVPMQRLGSALEGRPEADQCTKAIKGELGK